jgi:hypothetical protein
MNSCVVGGLNGEAVDGQISGYMEEYNKEMGRVVPDDSNGRITELMESSIRSSPNSVIVVGVSNCISPYVIRITVILRFIKYCN